MHWFTGLFVLLLLASTAMRSWLNQRQVAAVLRHRARVPEAFAQQIDLAAHQKAADYTVARRGAEPLGCTAGCRDRPDVDPGRRHRRHRSLVASRKPVAGVARHGRRTVHFACWSSAIGLPLSLWRTFGIEARFGFNRMTPALYVADLVKSLVLSLLLGRSADIRDPVPDAAGRRRCGGCTPGWCGSAFTVLITWAWPTLFAPLFNKFTPLSDESLKQRTEALLERCGFASKGVFVMDGSRRSVHGNAYFTGVGRNKRIVFFDTLIERLQIAEVEAVLAHELGHFRLHHVRSRLILSLGHGLAGTRVAGCAGSMAGVLFRARCQHAVGTCGAAAFHVRAAAVHLLPDAAGIVVVAQT